MSRHDVVIVHDGTKDLKRRLRGIERRIQNPERAWKSVGAYVSKSVRQQWTTRGGRMGTPWAPLAPSTVADKKRNGWPRTPLVRTGDMRRGFTGRPMDIERITGQTAVFGSSSKVAGWQHRGTTRHGRPHIPARPILKLTPDMRKDIADIMKKHIVGRRKSQ